MKEWICLSRNLQEGLKFIRMLRAVSEFSPEGRNTVEIQVLESSHLSSIPILVTERQ